MRCAVVISLIAILLACSCGADPVPRSVDDVVIQNAQTAVNFLNQRRGEHFELRDPAHDVLPKALLFEQYGRGGVNSGTRFYMTLRLYTHDVVTYRRIILLTLPNDAVVERCTIVDPQSDPSPRPSAADPIILAKAKAAVAEMDHREHTRDYMLGDWKSFQDVRVDGELGQPNTHYWFTMWVFTPSWCPLPSQFVRVHLLTNETGGDEVIELFDMAPVTTALPCATSTGAHHVQPQVESAAQFAMEKLHQKIVPHEDWQLELPSRDIYDVMVANLSTVGSPEVRFFMTLMLSALHRYPSPDLSPYTLHRFHRVDVVLRRSGTYELLHDDELQFDDYRVVATDYSVVSMAQWAVEETARLWPEKRFYLWNAPQDIFDFYMAYITTGTKQGTYYNFIMRLHTTPQGAMPYADHVVFRHVAVLDDHRTAPPTRELLPGADDADSPFVTRAASCALSHIAREKALTVDQLWLKAVENLKVFNFGEGRNVAVRYNMTIHACQNPSGDCFHQDVDVVQHTYGNCPWLLFDYKSIYDW